jgi:hypothetical protein
MRYTVRVSTVSVIGRIWMPSVPAATTYTLSESDVGNARSVTGRITRESVQEWLNSHAGDFAEITDFSASIEDGADTVEIPWADEESELTFNDLTFGDEG